MINTSRNQGQEHCKTPSMTMLLHCLSLATRCLRYRLAVLDLCGHDGVSTHPYDTTQHHIAPHHTTPHHTTPRHATPDHTTPTHTQVAEMVYILIAEKGFDSLACAAYVEYLQGSTHGWQKQRLVDQPPTVRCHRAASTGGCLFVITEGLFVIRIHVFYRILPVFYPYSTHFPKLTVFYRIHQERTRIHKNTQEYEHVEEGERHILRK